MSLERPRVASVDEVRQISLFVLFNHDLTSATAATATALTAGEEELDLSSVPDSALTLFD